MPSPAVLGKPGTGHGCYPGTNINSSCGTVYMKGILASRVGDTLGGHGCPDNPPHPVRTITAAGSSSSVFVEGSKLALIGSAIDCGGAVIGGAATITSN